jgi:hypothetical protein
LPEFQKHLLSSSILIDNYGATYLINTKVLLDPRTFVATLGKAVESGTSSLLIFRRRRRTIRNALLSSNNKQTRSLVLNDVAIIEGFHVNIISEALLAKARI